MGADRAALALALALAFAPGTAPAQAFLIWGVQVEQVEGRFGDGDPLLAWDGDAFVGTDELKVVLRSEGEYAFEENGFEKLENQLRLQVPVSEFFDAVAGVRVDTPSDGPDRVHGVVGLHGLARQWFEVDADMFLSDYPTRCRVLLGENRPATTRSPSARGRAARGRTTPSARHPACAPVRDRAPRA
jgi:copper resistance protein B